MEQFNDLYNQFKINQETGEMGTKPTPTPEELKKQAAEELRNRTFGGIKKIFFSIVSLFAEALIVKLLWNFVLVEHPLTYWQSMAFIVLVRLVIGGINKKN